MVDDEGKDEKVEKHVKGIEPKILSELGLVSSPRAKDLEHKEEERDADQPIEVITPARLADFLNEILPIACVGIVDDLE